MKLHRFIGDFDLSKMVVEINNPENIKQIKNVLRLGVGDVLILCDGAGMEAQAMITSLSKGSIIVEILKQKNSENSLEKSKMKINKEVNLYLAILKKENFELAVQKAVECGVSKIIPVITERTIKTGLNKIRLEKIIKEASEQSGRNIVPALLDTINFKEALSKRHFDTKDEESGEKIIFHFTDQEYKPNKNTKNASIFIGPEGGFTEKEIALAKDFGYKVTSLGSFTLRAETAAIVGTYRVIQGI